MDTSASQSPHTVEKWVPQHLRDRLADNKPCEACNTCICSLAPLIIICLLIAVEVLYICILCSWPYTMTEKLRETFTPSNAHQPPRLLWCWQLSCLQMTTSSLRKKRRWLWMSLGGREFSIAVILTHQRLRQTWDENSESWFLGLE